MSNNLLASAPNLESIVDCVTRFYMGEVKTLEEERPGTYRVVSNDGVPCLGVRVVKRGKRYRFEMVI